MTILPPNCHLQCLPHRVKRGLNAIYWIRCHPHFPNYRGSRYTRELLDICPVSRKCQVFTASLYACYHDIIILYADEHVLSFMTVRGSQRPSSGHHTRTSCSDGLSCSSDVFFLRVFRPVLLPSFSHTTLYSFHPFIPSCQPPLLPSFPVGMLPAFQSCLAGWITSSSLCRSSFIPLLPAFLLSFLFLSQKHNAKPKPKEGNHVSVQRFTPEPTYIHNRSNSKTSQINVATNLLCGKLLR